MPNIIITNYCNLSCPYCFANSMMNLSKHQDISKEQLDKILNWLDKSDNENYHIGLIGGEPTLHHDFKRVINQFNNFFSYHNGDMILFTNGLYLDKYIDIIPNNMSILLNINKLNKLLENKLIENLQILNNLNFLKEKVCLGCNLCLDITDYSFFWNIIDKFNTNNQINKVRMSITAPTKLKDKQNKELYYNNMKIFFLDFINEAKKRNIKIGNDCNQIPTCYFKDKRIFEIFTNPRYFICSPVVDITQDFKATSCFGISEFIDCDHFETINELYQYFYLKILPKKINNNNQGKCKNCKDYIYGKCQGGCLAFSK